jgi:hypothetical protein
MIKPGLQSTEFYGMLLTQVIGILVMAGVITPDSQDAWVQGLGLMIGGLISLGTGVAYILGRTELKKYFLKEAEQVSTTTVTTTLPEQPDVINVQVTP